MSTMTSTRTTVVTATETRVQFVLRRVRVEFLAANRAGLVGEQMVADWVSDLQYMLVVGAITHFEIRLVRDGRWHAAWRYTVSADGTLLETSEGGGIDFYGQPSGTVASLIIQRAANLAADIQAELIRRGWTYPAESITGDGERERAYSKDSYGLIRTSFKR